MASAAILGPRSFERMTVQSPLEHYRFCRSLLLDPSAPREWILQALRYPYARTYQPSIAAASLLSLRLGRNTPPVIPRLLPSGAPAAMLEDRKSIDSHLPIAIAEELAFYWQELGLVEEAKKAEAWASRFQGAARRLYIREEAFFETIDRSAEGIAADSTLGLLASSSIAFTLTGWNSALGAMRFNDVVISALGPQAAPLSDAKGFGITQLYAHGACLFQEKNRAEIEGWTRCHGSPESWLHLRAQWDERLDLHFRLASNEKVWIAFYIQAKTCRAGNQIFESGTLRRYQGKVEPLLFNESVSLECQRSDQELQIIPLAGINCFWNADYLIAFTCPSNEKMSFHLAFK